MSQGLRRLAILGGVAASATWATWAVATWVRGLDILCEFGARDSLEFLIAVQEVPTTGAIVVIALMCGFGLNPYSLRIPSAMILLLTAFQAIYLCWVGYSAPL